MEMMFHIDLWPPNFHLNSVHVHQVQSAKEATAADMAEMMAAAATAAVVEELFVFLLRAILLAFQTHFLFFLRSILYETACYKNHYDTKMYTLTLNFTSLN